MPYIVSALKKLPNIEVMHDPVGAIWLDTKSDSIKLVSQATIQSNSRAEGLLSQVIWKIPTFNHSSGCNLEKVSMKASLNYRSRRVSCDHLHIVLWLFVISSHHLAKIESKIAHLLDIIFWSNLRSYGLFLIGKFTQEPAKMEYS
jgi:hypothetical protein